MIWARYTLVVHANLIEAAISAPETAESKETKLDDAEGSEGCGRDIDLSSDTVLPLADLGTEDVLSDRVISLISKVKLMSQEDTQNEDIDLEEEEMDDGNEAEAEEAEDEEEDKTNSSSEGQETQQEKDGEKEEQASEKKEKSTTFQAEVNFNIVQFVKLLGGRVGPLVRWRK